MPQAVRNADITLIGQAVSQAHTLDFSKNRHQDIGSNHRKISADGNRLSFGQAGMLPK